MAAVASPTAASTPIAIGPCNFEERFLPAGGIRGTPRRASAYPVQAIVASSTARDAVGLPSRTPNTKNRQEDRPIPKTVPAPKNHNHRSHAGSSAGTLVQR